MSVVSVVVLLCLGCLLGVVCRLLCRLFLLYRVRWVSLGLVLCWGSRKFRVFIVWLVWKWLVFLILKFMFLFRRKILIFLVLGENSCRWMFECLFVVLFYIVLVIQGLNCCRFCISCRVIWCRCNRCVGWVLVKKSLLQMWIFFLICLLLGMILLCIFWLFRICLVVLCLVLLQLVLFLVIMCVVVVVIFVCSCLVGEVNLNLGMGDIIFVSRCGCCVR